MNCPNCNTTQTTILQWVGYVPNSKDIATITDSRSNNKIGSIRDDGRELAIIFSNGFVLGWDKIGNRAFKGWRLALT